MSTAKIVGVGMNADEVLSDAVGKAERLINNPNIQGTLMRLSRMEAEFEIHMMSGPGVASVSTSLQYWACEYELRWDGHGSYRVNPQ